MRFHSTNSHRRLWYACPPQAMVKFEEHTVDEARDSVSCWPILALFWLLENSCSVFLSLSSEWLRWEFLLWYVTEPISKLTCYFRWVLCAAAFRSQLLGQLQLWLSYRAASIISLSGKMDPICAAWLTDQQVLVVLETDQPRLSEVWNRHNKSWLFELILRLQDRKVGGALSCSWLPGLLESKPQSTSQLILLDCVPW
jgi:hypothetical protein